CMIFGRKFTRRINAVHHSSLNAKYQIKEASTVSHIIFVVGFVSLCCKMTATLWVWLYVLDLVPFSVITTSAVMMHTVNCGIVGYLFIWKHEGARKRTIVLSRFCC
ncbi:hypothetical protein PMAYCL1PPCAC_16082, partial [Pristionchus mayeri]